MRVEPQPAPGLLSAAGGETEDGTAPKGLWTRMLHPQQTFDSFIPGASNEFGHGAARAFAEGRGGDLPLLYIHGGFGYGKTHLLNAAALEFRKRGKRVLFLRAEDFMRHFLGALYRKDTLSFKDELRTADVLIIDDLQHICRSTATASEFLYTVNAFADLRRRVVIAADRAPSALEGLGADIKSRHDRRAGDRARQARPRHAPGHPEIARRRVHPAAARSHPARLRAGTHRRHRGRHPRAR